MVNARRHARRLSGLFAAVLRDMQGWWALARVASAVRPGLFTYHVRPSDGTRRIHLRIQKDGSGLLLVDATDALHLNPSAAFLVKCALDGMPLYQAVVALKGRFRGVKNNEAQQHAQQMYSLVEHLFTTADACPTCGLESLAWAPLFSLPVAAPFKADLALTYGCNNACMHCYNRVESKQQRKIKGEEAILSIQKWREVLDRLIEACVPHVIFTGGEPTLFPGLCELIRYAEQLGMITGLNTNGRRLADRAFVNSLVQAGLSHVQITLESCHAAVHNTMTDADSFDETCQGIKNAIAGGLHTITNSTLTRRNVNHALEIVDFLHCLGIRTFAMNGVIFSGRGLICGDELEASELATMLAAVRDRAAKLGMRFLWYTPTDYCLLSPLELELGPRRCNAGEYSMCIEPNGDVLPCQSYYTVAGNILRDSWNDIWQSGLFRSFRDRTSNPRQCGLPEKCWECPDLSLCAGGCRLEREKQQAVGS